ncbi:hypothetical protein [Gloeothece verrucosa]|nr:hypothetical protein [Gloeothece verrucosa]
MVYHFAAASSPTSIPESQPVSLLAAVCIVGLGAAFKPLSKSK